MRVCPHVNQMDLDKVVFNMQDLLAVDVDYVQEEQENNKMAIFLSNRKNDAWVCLNQNCSLILKEFDGGPTGHKRSNGHKLMLNAHTFEVWCMECGLEIFDLEDYHEMAKEFAPEELPKDFPTKDIRRVRQVFMDKMQEVKPLPSKGKGVFLDHTKTCNHLTSCLYLMAGVDYIRAICEKLYLASVECIKKREKTFLPNLIHHFARGVYHASKDSLDETILEELLKAIARHMTCSYAFSFTKFGHYMDDLLGHLNHYMKYLRWDKKGSELGPEELISKSKLQLYMDEELIEDSPLMSAFGGKYLTMKRCPNCNQLDIDFQEFMTLSLNAFKGDDDTNHIYSIRKEFGVQPVSAGGGWGLFKPFGNNFILPKGYYWANIWDVSMEDYLANHFLHDLVVKTDKTFCQHCEDEVQLEICYRLNELPNYLMVTFRYEEIEMEEHMRLRNFMELTLASVSQKKYINKERNPFDEEDGDEVNYDYTLKAMVAFEDKQNPDSCYNTYVKKGNNSWHKYSKTYSSAVDAKELEAIIHPYVLIYEKVWSAEKPRVELLTQMEADVSDTAKDLIPVPDFWAQKAKHLAQPGYVEYSHLLCSHGKLRPHYKDVMPNDQWTIELGRSDFENDLNLASPIRNAKKSSKMGDAKASDSESSFTYYSLKSSSVQLNAKTLERIVRDPKVCIDSNLDILRKVDFKQPCQECIATQQILIVRRHIESKLVQNLQQKDAQDGPFFAINAEWANNWSLFINFADDDSRIVNKFLFDQFKSPESIKNKELMADKKANEDAFIFVVGPVMQALELIYGCDQLIGRANQKFDSEKLDLKQDYLTEEDRELIQKIKATTQSGYKVTYDELCKICTEENKRLKALRRKIKNETEYEEDEGEIDEGADDEGVPLDSSEATTQSNTNKVDSTELDQSRANLVNDESNVLIDRQKNGRKQPREVEMANIRSGI